MLDTTTKKRIDDCRDILVGKLPDPKAQIEQITIGLIYKFMDDMDKEAIELGGKAKFFSGKFEKYNWDHLFDAKTTANDMLALYSEALTSMDKNPNIPQLFCDIFKNAFLPYRDPETLKLFLKTIGEFEYTHSEKLGDAFEYLLSVMGSQGDAGQFRTPRHIIDFLVAVVNPKKNETILDPACGTAGFLISAYKHILLRDTKANKDDLNIFQFNNNFADKPFNNLGDQLTPDDRKKLINNFTGYDISPDMVRLSLVNLYLHGFSDPHVWEYDTLSSEDRWNETADVILANPPFMSPKGGIRPHKKFSIGSNRSEVLFVDYIAEHLNPKGRAGVIVPEGVIFQSGTAYKELRKMLVENYLYAVVSLPAGVFNPYSGVKTSILLMDKEFAKTSEEILFVKIENDGFGLGAQRNAVKGGQLEDAIAVIRLFAEAQCISSQQTTIAHTVPKSEIARNGDYNLSGERYNNKNHFQKSNIEIVKLEDIAGIEYGYTDTAKDEGDARFIRITDINEYGQLKMDAPKYINLNKEAEKYILNKNDILVARTGATFGKTLIYDNNEKAVFASFLIRINLNTDKIIPKFYWAFAQSDVYWNQANNLVTGGGQPQFNGNALKQIQIPLPPISIQQEIVAEIEGYQKIIDGAKMVVENYKPKIDIDPEWEMVELGEILTVLTDYHANGSYEVLKENVTLRDKKDYAWLIRSTDFENDFKNDFKYIDKKAYDFLAKSEVFSGDVIINKIGNAGKIYLVPELDMPCSLAMNQFLLRIEPSKGLNKFIYYYLKQPFSEIEINKHLRGATTKTIDKQSVRSIHIMLPSLEIQHQIVSQIEKEQELVNASKQLIEIFEQKIKDRIAKVWGE